MTIALAVKVGDGVVLSADSASTFLDGGGSVHRVYNNANKITNLRKGLPVGFISWGLGSIGRLSLSTLLKDLRVRFAGLDPDRPEWEMHPKTYTLDEVAQRVREFLYEEHYAPAFAQSPVKPDLGGILAGFSAGDPMAEAYHIEITNGGQCGDPQPLGLPDSP